MTHMRGGHAAGERERPAAAFERRDRGFEGLARRVAAARIIELAPLAGLVLHERRSDVNRRHDGPGLRVAFLADVDGAGAELHGAEGGRGKGTGDGIRGTGGGRDDLSRNRAMAARRGECRRRR